MIEAFCLWKHFHVSQRIDPFICLSCSTLDSALPSFVAPTSALLSAVVLFIPMFPISRTILGVDSFGNSERRPELRRPGIWGVARGQCRGVIPPVNELFSCPVRRDFIVEFNFPMRRDFVEEFNCISREKSFRCWSDGHFCEWQGAPSCG